MTRARTAQAQYGPPPAVPRAGAGIPPLPSPPVCHVNGVRCILERVRIEDLDAWARERDLVEVGPVWMGQPHRYEAPDGTVRWGGLGTVILFWPKDGREGGDPCHRPPCS